MSFELPERFLEEIAAETPAPGAGAAAAVTAAMAAALVEMTARFSREPEAAEQAAALRRRLLPLPHADAEAYAAVLGSRGDARRRALSRAADVPLQVAEEAARVRALATELLERGNQNLRGEAATAALLAEAAIRSAGTLVLINLADAGEDARAARARELVRDATTAGAGPAKPTWALGRRATVAQGEVAWEMFGTGPAVVLVHGTPSWSYLWRNVVPTLAECFTVYVFDLVGYGGSPASGTAEISIAAHARTLVELLDRWGLEAPAIAGHDIGGAAVLDAHLLHRRAFRRIALVDAVALAPWITATSRHVQAHLDAYEAMPSHIFERLTEAHLRTAVHRELPPDALAAYQAPWSGPGGQAAYLRKVESFDEEHTRAFEHLLPTIHVPVRILWGAEDAWLDPAVARRLSGLIPGAELTLIEDAGHFSPEDAPAEVATALLDFFSGA